MNLKQVIQWLMDNKYGLVVNNQFILTQKVNHELFNTPVTEEVVLQTVQSIPQVVSVPIRITSPDQKKTIWNEFVERAGVPYRVKSSDGGTYTVRQYSPSAVNKLIQIIKDPAVSYDKLVESTKHYYATVSYKVLLSNYLIKDIWKDEYDNYKKVELRSEGSNIFED